MDDDQRRRVTYEPCGCLTNDDGAHRGDCPEFRTVKDASGRALYWVRWEEAVGG